MNNHDRQGSLNEISLPLAQATDDLAEELGWTAHGYVAVNHAVRVLKKTIEKIRRMKGRGADEEVPVQIVMEQPPGPESQFVEVERPEGQSITLGKWKQREDGPWCLEFLPSSLR